MTASTGIESSAELVARESTALPIAAHAEPDATCSSVTSPEYAIAALVDAVTTENALATRIAATLRPYQAAGVAWIVRTCLDQGGALLADEMGLGKTLQALGALALLNAGPSLIVCPTSLVTNWSREIERFCPDLATSVTIISYARLRLAADSFGEKQWGAVIFDEAQALKNPRTQVARAARTLSARYRIGLTGTPVENTLDELWALLQVLTPALFPVKAVFRRRFTRAAESGDDGAVRRLRTAVSPVMLARTKDRAATALPPKIENPIICDLSAEQAREYDACLARAVEDGFGQGLARHGKLLAVLTTLKQICNYPTAGVGVEWEPGRSGKFDVAMTIIEGNLAAARPTLIFTQYRETGELLARAASALTDEAIPFFHGGLSVAERTRIADRFQTGTGPAVLVVSLKAGGTGLTLTRASEVMHFDRWWNPAVEAQATDRAHRIGQHSPSPSRH